MIDFDETFKQEIRWDFSAQFEGFLKIEEKSGQVVRPVANIHQLRLDAAVKAAHRLGRPCRIIALKPRQKGSSTGSVGIGHARLKAKRGRGLIAGGKHFQGANLFRILKTYADNDELDPKTCKVMDMEARYANGSMMQRITLASGDAGRSGTYQFLTVTEAAYLSEEGVANADVVLDGLLKCVPLEEDTIIIVESTANGAAGYFYDTWRGGITLEEFEAGKQGYIKVFSAWFEFGDSWILPSQMGIESESDYTTQEIHYVDELEKRQGIRLSLGQVAWMRYAIKEECRGDWDKFRQDYPSDAETAFLTSGRCAFTADGIAYQESRVKRNPPEYGYLSYNETSDNVAFIPSHEGQAMCVRFERARIGCYYLISVDTMTGEDQTGGNDPDSHSILVHRAGYFDHTGRWIEPALVARNMMVPGHKPGTLACWWNIDVVAEEVWKLAKHYCAIVVPEMNMERGLVELLKLKGDVEIYKRVMFNRRENKETEAYGWVTDPATRRAVIEKLISAVRDAGTGKPSVGYEVRCPWIIEQMKNFGTKPNGRMEALSGHDDDVLSLAIGNALLDRATPYYEVRRSKFLPRDLQKMEKRNTTARGCFS